MQLRHLRYFVGIVEARSFSRAVATIHVAQPALSQPLFRQRLFLVCRQGGAPMTAGGVALRELAAVPLVFPAPPNTTRGLLDRAFLLAGVKPLIAAETNTLSSMLIAVQMGLDDWAWRRGRRYGTILVDLERNRVVDLLPDRQPDTLAGRLRQHPTTASSTRMRHGWSGAGPRAATTPRGFGVTCELVALPVA